MKYRLKGRKFFPYSPWDSRFKASKKIIDRRDILRALQILPP